MIYGILHLEPEETSAHNVRISNFQDQIEIYLRNAVTLAESLRLHGVEYTLLTNSKGPLTEIVQKLGRKLHMVEIPCITEVPSGFKFYSAHFKIDALKYISSTSDDYAILCDIDVICISKIPGSLQNIINRKMPLFYDISDQVIPAYGHHVIIDDITKISGIDAQGRWAGGEFISGPPAFFGELHDVIRDLWPKYLLHSKNLHHIGDEALLSAALEVMTDRGQVLGDAGTLGIISRFWSGRIKHAQRPLTHYRDNFLLHLPADKRFLADFPPKNLPRFFDRYKSYLGKKWPRNFAANALAKIKSRAMR